MMNEQQNPPPPEEKNASEAPPSEKPATGKPPLQLRPQLMNLLIFGFVLYALYYHFTQPKLAIEEMMASPSAAISKSEDASSKSSRNSQDPVMDQLYAQESFNSLKVLFPRFRTGVTTKTLVAGKGRAAFCGQKATYRLQKKGEKQVKTVTQLLSAPKDKLSQYLIWGIEGMREGEKREIRLPNNTSTAAVGLESPSDVLVYTAELLKLSPEMPVTGEMPLRRFMVKGNAGYDFRCGDVVMFHLTLRDASGELLFSSFGGDPVFTTVGAGKAVPLGIDMALKDMGPGGEYTIIIPPELAMPLYGKEPPAALPEGLKVQHYPVDLLGEQSQVLLADIQIPRSLYPSDEESE